MSNFWRNLDIPLFNCEVSLILNWSINYAILNNARKYAIAATELSAANVLNVKPAAYILATNATFKIVCGSCYFIN